MTKPAPRADVLEFLAAGEWSSSHLAWIPRERAPTSDAAREIVRAGLAAGAPGRFRDAAVATFERGDVRVERLPSLDGPAAGMMRIFNPDPEMRLDGRFLVQVTARGTLDERWLPLWTSRAGACAVAQALDGLVSHCYPSPVSSPARLLERMGVAPAFVLVEHVMILSSADERLRGRLTTLGMHDLGMPEIELNDVPASAIRGLGAAMNGIALHVLNAVLRTTLDVMRLVRMPAEFTLQRASIDAASRGSGSEAKPAAERGAVVRLRRATDANGDPWLFVNPPVAWMGGRRRWAESVAAVGAGR